MATYMQRYLGGEHEQVWAELLAQGAVVYAAPLYADAWAVAQETMRRVRHNIELIVPRLHALEYTFGYAALVKIDNISEDAIVALDPEPPIFAPPAADVAEHIAALEARLFSLPLALSAFFAIVGEVDLTGQRDDWGDYGLDPMKVMSAEAVQEMGNILHWNSPKPDGTYEIPFSPDEYHKFLYSGGWPYCIAVTGPAADAPLRHEWHDTTFVGYLRACCRWGGLPGLERRMTMSADDFTALTADLLPL